MNVENLYMIIKQIFFLVFSLNVVAIYSTLKIIDVSCNDNIVKLSYNDHHVISPIYNYTLMFFYINERCNMFVLD